MDCRFWRFCRRLTIPKSLTSPSLRTSIKSRSSRLSSERSKCSLPSSTLKYFTSLLKCKIIKDEVAIITTISLSLNGKNKEQDSKRDFEKLISSYNEISQLFGETQQASAFYTKLNDFISKLTCGIEDFSYARKVSGEDLENSIKNRGGSGFRPPDFPNMGPGPQQNNTVPCYSGPPPGSGFMNSPPPSAFNFGVAQQPFDPRTANVNDLFRMIGDSFNQLNPFNSNSNSNRR